VRKKTLLDEELHQREKRYALVLFLFLRFLLLARRGFGGGERENEEDFF